MFKLLAVFAAALVLAYISERNTKAVLASGRRYAACQDWAYVLLVAVLVLFAGLRTSYNDTWNYISGFHAAPSLTEFFSDADHLNPFKNPLYYLFVSALRSLTDESQVLIFLTALFTQACFLRFFKRYASHFTFSIFLYFTLGTFVFTLAAIKQVVAMAIATLAFSYLEKKKWGRYYLIILIAMLVHTYAIFFAVLPLFMNRPWKAFTYLFVLVVVVVMMNFRDAISAFMDQANDLGKTLADYEVFDKNTINIFRLAVYAVVPLMSWMFQRWLYRDSVKMDHVLIHMSIISLAFMSMGTQSGANMFARMAMYFDLGTICCLPPMLDKIFEARSRRFVAVAAVVCYLVFFVYANMDFGSDYKALSLWDLIFP